MKVLGLDIGTTTVSAVVVCDGVVASALTLKNGSFLDTGKSWEKVQDPAYICATALSAVDSLLQEHPDVQRIGITGQMHGIVYLDKDGKPVSPLYTWQDGRGDLPHPEGGTWVEHLSRETGYPLATGFGMVTHYVNQHMGLVPEAATVFCTIHDYIAMVLAGATTPVTESSDAASFGLFDVEHLCFDMEAVKKAGMDVSMVPQLAVQGSIGAYRGIPVYAAIGDNQASFLGATEGCLQAMLVNVGTGSQFSVYTPKYMTCPGLETRPFPGGYLLVGSSLCGGRAYALLENFLRQTVQAVTGQEPESCYEALAKLLESQERPADMPRVTPLFQGTRQDPSLRGSIQGLSTENFTPRHFAWAMLEGMAGELHEMYCSYLAAGGEPVALIGSGNGMRKNIHLQQCFARLFGQNVTMSGCTEEAATGAARFAAMQPC